MKPQVIDGYTVIQSDWTDSDAVVRECAAIDAGPKAYKLFLAELQRERDLKNK
jgi:hypothetical protein